MERESGNFSDKNIKKIIRNSVLSGAVTAAGFGLFFNATYEGPYIQYCAPEQTDCFRAQGHLNDEKLKIIVPYSLMMGLAAGGIALGSQALIFDEQKQSKRKKPKKPSL